jgi:hypothetical protein
VDSEADPYGRIIGFLDRSRYFFFQVSSFKLGARGSLVVKALGYKLEGPGFENRRGEILDFPDPSGRTRPWGLLSL